ncbi:MAG: bi-domain-containing oxidoreductase [Thermodesulfobacteriota bacterium]
MLQVLQNLGNGKTVVADVPVPQVGRGRLLIVTQVSLVSAGTERMLLDFGKAGWLAKARSQPEKVRQVLDKVKTDGLLPTIEAVRSKLDQPIALGYCNVGRVVEVGAGVEGFAPGDRVASNGHHAEVVCVPQHLCARIPDAVDDQSAAFTVIGAIALQGIRLLGPTLGEAMVVIGLGLIGQVAVQLLRAHGCRVLGVDVDAAKCALAQRFGAETIDLSKGEDLLTAAHRFSRGRGVDGVLITASTQSNEPVHQAAQMCRKRGRIVLVGVVGLELRRSDFYEKELSFQVSCSYGPGRYDPQYEEKGCDYPIGYVRWTEQRNFEAVLDMMAEGSLNVNSLISHRFPIDRATEAYALIAGREPCLGVLLEYPNAVDADRNRTLPLALSVRHLPCKGSVAFIGAGNYAGRVLIPAFKAAGAFLHTVASSGGVSGVYYGKKYGFVQTTTDTRAAIANPEVDTVVVATRHNSHTRLVIEAFQAGKHVFVEKPLCLSHDELKQIEEVISALTEKQHSPLLMVGFNRRFAPLTQKIKALLSGVREPKSFIMTVNAGAIPAEHWTQDPEVGGGRIVGEACHFIDLLRFLADAPIVRWQRLEMTTVTHDTVSLQLGFADGSIGTVHYFANGSKSFPKERLEVFCAGRVLQLDNFRRLIGYGWPGFRKLKLWRQDKGQAACAAAFVEAVREGKEGPIPLTELIEVSRIVIDLASVNENR